MGLHLHGRPALVGVESQVDSTIGGRPPPTWEVGIPPLGGSPSWARFAPSYGRFWFRVLFEDLDTNTWDPPI